MDEGDLPSVLAVQQPGAVVGLADVFPQDRYPFPQDEVLGRWRVELADPAIALYVATDSAGEVVAFAARRGDEVLHLGTALETWGSGLASWLLGELLATFAAGPDPLRLWVFTDNHRGRRFYEKEGWVPTGRVTRSTFPPCPQLLEYELHR